MPTATTKTIEIIPPNIEQMFVTIRGVTPLLCSNGEAAIPLLDIGFGPLGQPLPKEPKNFDSPAARAEYEASRYRLPDGTDGFPARGIKRALKDAGIRNKAGVGTEIVAAVQIDADLIPINGSEPLMVQHYVRHGGRTPDLAYRAQFTKWSLRVPVAYNAGVIAREHVLSLFTLAGFSIGIGAWRTEKNGTFGRFVIDTVEA